MELEQFRIKLLSTGYKYTNIIRVSESIDLSAPSGVSGKSYKIKVYGMEIFNRSS